MPNSDMPDPVRAPLLDKVGNGLIRHGYFTRSGGVSTGIYAGLNTGVGSNDEPARVAENRSRVAEWFGAPSDSLSTPYQIHSADAVVVERPIVAGERPKADAVVTRQPGLPIGVGTADCGPVLFAAPRSGVVGAAHAGWKGAFTGVLEATIEAMEGLGAERSDIVAILGPSISQANYEVGPEFVRRFAEDDAENDRYFSPSPVPGHAMFDLNRYTVDRLRRAGVTADFLDRCTYGEEDLFYSYRRSTHRREPDYGRQISVIMLETR